MHADPRTTRQLLEGKCGGELVNSKKMREPVTGNDLERINVRVDM